MMPTHTRFSSPKLRWFVEDFMNEFGPHKPWQCPVAHPALNAAMCLEESELDWDTRERLIRLLACFTRLALSDQNVYFASLLITAIASPLCIIVLAQAIYVWFIRGLLPLYGPTIVLTLDIITLLVTIVIVPRLVLLLFYGLINVIRRRDRQVAMELASFALRYIGNPDLGRADVVLLADYNSSIVDRFRRAFSEAVRQVSRLQRKAPG